MNTLKNWKPKKKVKTSKKEGHRDADVGENGSCWRTKGPGERGEWDMRHQTYTSGAVAGHLKGGNVSRDDWTMTSAER